MINILFTILVKFNSFVVYWFGWLKNIKKKTQIQIEEGRKEGSAGKLIIFSETQSCRWNCEVDSSCLFWVGRKLLLVDRKLVKAYGIKWTNLSWLLSAYFSLYN